VRTEAGPREYRPISGSELDTGRIARLIEPEGEAMRQLILESGQRVRATD